jgi:hypothetical protein
MTNTKCVVRTFRAPASVLSVLCLLLALAPVSSRATQCKCHKPEKGDTTRWGGNQAVVVVPDKPFRKIEGIVELGEEALEGALVEVFDKPDYLVNNRPWANKPEQKLLKSCVTSLDGKFCFQGLAAGKYEIRISKAQGINVTHVYAVVDYKAMQKDEPLHITMSLGN